MRESVARKLAKEREAQVVRLRGLVEKSIECDTQLRCVVLIDKIEFNV